MSDVTAVLVSYRRQENVCQLVETLRQQTLRPELMLINNWDMRAFQIERTAFIPWNAGPMARYLFAVYAETEWLMFIDDDLMPSDVEFVADALAIAKQRPAAITGAYGRQLAKTPRHYRKDAQGDVAIIKGRFQMMRRSLLDQVYLPPMGNDVLFACDDIYVCLEAGRGEPVHWADGALAERLVEMPEGGNEVALSLQQGHMQRREAACAWWLKERA